ncbi:hypothetical protein C8A00DRAFT_42490 [Chaetomidium leptoderma]|uniref:Uncharacterized protein n=1 Tax=Chaetomidium leptoderma TaxID=669021 RepID=A0AAN6VNW9_9PEZI|nr:hypothetical protein C8A00DRAFT_42490 [Chaetomidium leptoderma]
MPRLRVSPAESGKNRSSHTDHTAPPRGRRVGLHVADGSCAPSQTPINESVALAVADDELSAPLVVAFLDWATFDETTLPPRKNARRSRLDRILSPLKSVSAGLPGNVSVEGLGGIIESAHGLFHSVRRLDFMESERIIYLLPSPGTPPPHKMPRRELERFENELFDLSKYDGSCDYLTAMAWTEETLAGAITLYEVLFGDDGETVGIRPVATMRDVPSPVLVKMRTDERIKRKAVLTPIDDDDHNLEWRASPTKGPRYVKLGHTAPTAAHVRSPHRSRSRQPGVGLADANGVCATLPQFVALLHARRTILEGVESSRITPITIEECDNKPAVFLFEPPLSNPHEGDGVHVAVLMPNDALWAEEEIVWTDQTGLAEFRQRQYWDLIDRPSRRARSRSRSRSRSRDRSRMREVDQRGHIHPSQRSETRLLQF